MRTLFGLFMILLVSGSFLCPPYAAPPLDKAKYQVQITSLQLLLKSIDQASKEITAIQEILQSPRGIGREQELRSRINDLSLKLKGVEETFNQLSTGVDSRVFKAEKKEGFNWNLELTELLGPVIKELKKMTSRPREI